MSKVSRFEYLRDKVSKMQVIVDEGFESWVDEDTKKTFLEKFENRKKEVNDLYREILQEKD